LLGAARSGGFVGIGVLLPGVGPGGGEKEAGQGGWTTLGTTYRGKEKNIRTFWITMDIQHVPKRRRQRKCAGNKGSLGKKGALAMH